MSRKSGINLTPTQEMQLKKFAKTTRDAREYRSALGVLSRGEGKSAQEVADHLRVTKKQVFAWCRKYREHSVAGLRVKKQTGRPATQGNAAKKIIPKLLKQDPQAFGYLKGRWVVRDISKALKSEGVHLSFQSVHRILDDLNIGLKMPRLRAPGSIRKNYSKRRVIKNYKRMAAALLKKESPSRFRTKNG